MDTDVRSPAVSAAGRIFWAACAERRFSLPACSGCGRLRWYPLPTCRHCHTADYGWRDLSGDATLFSYSIVHRSFAPEFEGKLPYTVAFVLPVEDEEVRFVTQIVDCEPDRLEIGMKMKVAFTERDGVQMPFFRPA